jgi:hypothetical protein
MAPGAKAFLWVGCQPLSGPVIMSLKPVIMVYMYVTDDFLVKAGYQVLFG